MNNVVNFPFFIKATFLVIGLYVVLTMLYIGQGLIIPIVYATLLAILLSPAVRLLVRYKIPRVPAILFVVIVAITLLILLVIYITSQASLFNASIPGLIDKFYLFLNNLVVFYSEKLDISSESINGYLLKARIEMLSHLNELIGTTISTVGTTIIHLLLVIVYIFMILYYKPLLMEFIHKISGTRHRNRINELMDSTKSLIQSYLLGLLIEAVIVAAMYSGGLFIIGIQYAILLGIIGALLNIIPYLGGVIAASLYMLIAFATKDSPSYVLYVLLLFVIVHVIDNSFIIPKVVASKVKINALVAITAVLSGGALWGVAGMFISIPLAGVLKLIFDRTNRLKPYGYLLGDSIEPTEDINLNKNI